MKLKLDENLGRRVQGLVQSEGHEVYSVHEQQLSGKPDIDIYERCCSEGCCLVTLDLDFSDVTRFPPKHSSGVAVLRLPKNPTLELLVRQLLAMVRHSTIDKQLWIVEPGRIRVHQTEADSEP